MLVKDTTVFSYMWGSYEMGIQGIFISVLLAGEKSPNLGL